MKTITCKEFGGACDMEFHAEEFTVMINQISEHTTKMAKEGDLPHQKAMQKRTKMMKEGTNVNKWVQEKYDTFMELPES